MVAFQGHVPWSIWIHNWWVRGFLRYQPYFGYALSYYQCTKISPKLSKFAKIYPKTMSLWKFEIPPKSDFLIIFKKINSYGREALKHVLIFWIFNTTIFYMSFLLSKNSLRMWILAYLLVKNDFFLQCSTCLVDMRFCRQVPN